MKLAIGYDFTPLGDVELDKSGGIVITPQTPGDEKPIQMMLDALYESGMSNAALLEKLSQEVNSRLWARPVKAPPPEEAQKALGMEQLLATLDDLVSELAQRLEQGGDAATKKRLPDS